MQTNCLSSSKGIWYLTKKKKPLCAKHFKYLRKYEDIFFKGTVEQLYKRNPNRIQTVKKHESIKVKKPSSQQWSHGLLSPTDDLEIILKSY